MKGEEVDAELLDSSGRPFALAKRPSGLLVEAGDSLGASVNANFVFTDTEKTPKSLLVTHQGQTLRFRIQTASQSNTNGGSI